MSPKYTLGVDFGALSGRAVLVRVSGGAEIASAVSAYANGVIDERLPESGVRLEPDWALQDPKDEVFMPNPVHRPIYDQLYSEYVRLHDYFGRDTNSTIKILKRIKLASQGR